MEWQNRRKHRLTVQQILELEKLLLHGQSIETRISLLSHEQLQSSPLLLKEKGELLMREGKLLEAQKMLEFALQGLTSSAMQQEMLSAIGLLARTLLRTGQRNQAGTLLQFLKNERRKPSDKLAGHPAWALAQGCHLLDDVGLAFDCYSQAAAYFEEIADWKRAAHVYADKLFRLHGQMDRKYWMEDWRRLTQLAGFTPVAAALSQLLHTVDLYFSDRWEQANTTLNRLTAPLDDWFWRQFAAGMGRQIAVLLEHPSDKSFPDPRNDEVQDIEMMYWTELTQYLQRTACHESAKCAESEATLTSLIHRGVHPVFQAMTERLKKRAEQAASFHVTLKPWRISWFGGLAFHRGSESLHDLPWKRRKSLELLLLLLTMPRYSVSKDWAIEILFGDSDTGNASNQLYVTVHQLKKVLQAYLGVGQAVQLKGGTIRLQEFWMEDLDIEHFTTLVRVGDQLWFTERELAVELYVQAAEMYNSPVPEIQYIDWLDRYRNQLAEQQSRILQRLCIYCYDAGRMDETAAYAMRWIELNPLQEEAYQMLMTVLIQLGKKTEAQSLYHQWEKLCREDLGAEPHPTTKRILTR